MGTNNPPRFTETLDELEAINQRTRFAAECCEKIATLNVIAMGDSSEWDTYGRAVFDLVHSMADQIDRLAVRTEDSPKRSMTSTPPLNVLKAKRELYEGTYVPLARLQQAQGLGLGKIYVDPDLGDDDWFVVTGDAETI